MPLAFAISAASFCSAGLVLTVICNNRPMDNAVTPAIMSLRWMSFIAFSYPDHETDSRTEPQNEKWIWIGETDGGRGDIFIAAMTRFGFLDITPELACETGSLGAIHMLKASTEGTRGKSFS